MGSLMSGMMGDRCLSYDDVPQSPGTPRMNGDLMCMMMDMVDQGVGSGYGSGSGYGYGSGGAEPDELDDELDDDDEELDDDDDAR